MPSKEKKRKKIPVGLYNATQKSLGSQKNVFENRTIMQAIV